MCEFILIYNTVEEAIDSAEFDQDGFALSGPIIRFCPSSVILVVNPKFRLLYTNQALE